MEFDGGYIKLHRSILKWEWYDDPITFRVFMHLLVTANWEDKRWHGIEVKRGQVITTYPKMAKRLGITVRSLRTALSHLESTGEVTRKTSNKGQVITVENYDKYQVLDSVTDTQTDTQTDRRPTRKRHASDMHTEEYKEIKEDEEVKERVLRAWNALSDLGIKSVIALNPGTSRYQLLNARLKQYGADNVLKAIEQIRHSSFLQGQGKNGWTVTFDWFLKPNNFIKVFEGQYVDRPQKSDNPFLDMLMRGEYSDDRTDS